MSALWLPPIETSLVQTEQEFPLSSSRRTWITLGILGIFVSFLLALAVWRVISPQPISLTEKFTSLEPSSQEILPASPQLSGATPALFDANEEQALASLENWENPLSSSPCFVRGLNTCQYSFFGGVGIAHDLNLYSLNLPKRQEKQDFFFLFGRMLVTHGPIYETQQPNLATGELQPYSLFLERVLAAGEGYAINPAFLFVVYDQVFLATTQSGLTTDQVFEFLPPERLAQNFSLALNTPITMRNTPLGKALENKNWTLEAQALVFTLATSLNVRVVDQALTEPGQFEHRYYEIFAPVHLRGDIRFIFAGAPLNTEQVFSASEPMYDYALCQEQKAYVCQQKDGVAHCWPFPLFNQYCPNLLNLPSSIGKNNESQKESL